MNVVRARDRSGWIIGESGSEAERRFEAPVEIDGWDERPWIRLRPLTAREALRRESLGLREELEPGADGSARAIRRRYDLEAMVAYELECCLVDYALPVLGPDGVVRCARREEGPGALGGELLDRMPTRLADWLAQCLDEINLRRPEDALEFDRAAVGELREGRDFRSTVELLARLGRMEVSADERPRAGAVGAADGAEPDGLARGETVRA